jgi:hypothetical protein
LKIEQCPELKEFFEKAPVSDVSLVFAAENISQPTSMMGHVFLDVFGTDKNGVEKSHALSFFTEVNMFNIPKVVIETLLTGQKGYFSLSPLSESLDFYRLKEQRDVWFYKLKLSDEQKTLLRLHAFELKGKNLTYLFKDYNCATFIYYLLAVAYPDILQESPSRMTPQDVVKIINKYHKIEKTQAYPSSRSTLRMLSDVQSQYDKELVEKMVATQDLTVIDHENERTRFIDFTAALALIDYKSDNKKNVLQFKRAIEVNIPKNFNIDLTQFKNPIKNSGDSQIYMSIGEDEKPYLTLGGMPAAHTLFDDNRQYFSENELRLADLAIRVDSNNGFLLDKMTLYSTMSLLPHDFYTGGISGRFNIAYQMQSFPKSRERVTQVMGGLGKSISLTDDVLIYGLCNIGVYLGRDKNYSFLQPELGLSIYEIANMKSFFIYNMTMHEWKKNDFTQNISWIQTLFLNKSISLEFRYNKYILQEDRKKEVIMAMKYLF